MKKVKFKVDDRVGLKYDLYDDGPRKLRYDPDEPPDFGVVTDLLSSGKLVVRWDNSYMNNGDQTVSPSNLMLELDLKVALSKLEKEFLDLEKEIKVKMKEAGLKIKEANKLAKKAGRSLQEMYDAVDPLVNAMDSAGWRSSSWGC